jgi:hypothetical protein
MTFTIGTDGRVTAAHANGFAPEDAACIERVLRALQFPALNSGSVEVRL